MKITVRQLTDPSGAVTLARSYDPYGVANTSGTDSSRYGYTGEQQDASGRVYLRARVYDPNQGRFLSRDTWSGEASRPLSLNRWNYVNGNPIRYIDPSGHRESCPYYDPDCDGIEEILHTNLSGGGQPQPQECTSVICIQPSPTITIGIPVFPFDFNKPCPQVTIGSSNAVWWETAVYVKKGAFAKTVSVVLLDSGAFVDSAAGSVSPVSGSIGQTMKLGWECPGLVGECVAVPLRSTVYG